MTGNASDRSAMPPRSLVPTSGRASLPIPAPPARAFGHVDGSSGSEEEDEINYDGEFFLPGSRDDNNIVQESVFGGEAAAVQQEVQAAYLDVIPQYRSLSGSKGQAYPHLWRCINNPEGKDLAKVYWDRMSGLEIMDILRCKYLGSGKLKTMAFWATALVKFLLAKKNTIVVDHASCVRLGLDLDASLKCERGVLTHPTICATIVEICGSPVTHKSVQSYLALYNKTHPIILKSGLFPDVSTTQQDQCRVAALMREPSLQNIFHALANPVQDRAHADTVELRIQQQRTKLYQDFCSAFNDPSVDPTFAVDIAPWCDIDVDVSVPAEPRTWMWIAMTMKDIKTKMSRHIANFMQSGRNANDSNDAARDLEFFDRFAKGNIVVMYAWLSWHHGREVPAWNSSLLPEDQRLELGSSGDSASDGGEDQPPPPVPLSCKKSRKDEPIVDRATLGAMVEMQKSLFQVALQKTSTDTATSVETVETARARALDALCSQAAQVEQLMKSVCTPADLRTTFTSHHRTLLERIAGLLISAPSS